jgi:endonuclease/exonuclease/phosphatase family metal-dependent hydrolase
MSIEKLFIKNRELFLKKLSKKNIFSKKKVLPLISLLLLSIFLIIILNAVKKPPDIKEERAALLVSSDLLTVATYNLHWDGQSEDRRDHHAQFIKDNQISIIALQEPKGWREDPQPSEGWHDFNMVERLFNQLAVIGWDMYPDDPVYQENWINRDTNLLSRYEISEWENLSDELKQNGVYVTYAKTMIINVEGKIIRVFNVHSGGNTCLALTKILEKAETYPEQDVILFGDFNLGLNNPNCPTWDNILNNYNYYTACDPENDISCEDTVNDPVFNRHYDHGVAYYVADHILLKKNSNWQVSHSYVDTTGPNFDPEGKILRSDHYPVIAVLVHKEASSIPSPTPTQIPQEVCESVGGNWQKFRNNCVDRCSLVTNPDQPCLRVITWACECGLDRCWDGTTCVPNPTTTVTLTPTLSPTNTPIPTPTPTPTLTPIPTNTPIPTPTLPPEEVEVILNSATGKTCDSICWDGGKRKSCISIGTDSEGTNSKYARKYFGNCAETSGGTCSIGMFDGSDTCFDHKTEWTNCRCQTPASGLSIPVKLPLIDRVFYIRLPRLPKFKLPSFKLF